MSTAPDKRNKFQASTTEPYIPGISKTSDILDRLCKLSISDLAEARREVSQAATELDYREFVKALSHIPTDAFRLFDPQNGYSTDILIKRDDCRDAVNVCAVLVFLMTTDGLDPYIASRFSELHYQAVRDKHDKSVNPTTVDHHAQVAIPGFPELEVDSECANLIGYLNATGSRTYFSCQGREQEGERVPALIYVTVARYGDADTKAAHSRLELLVHNPPDGDSFSSLLHDTVLPDIVAERNLQLRRYVRGVVGLGYVMFDFSDGGEAMRKAMSALVERAKITDPQFVYMLRGDYLDHLAKQVQGNEHEFEICIVGGKTWASFQQREPRYDDVPYPEDADEMVDYLAAVDVGLHAAEERRRGRRSTVRLPQAYIRLLNLAAGELLLELPVKSKMGKRNTVIAGDAIVYGAPLTSIAYGPFFGQATGRANLREELARTSPEATLRPSRNKNDAGVKYPYLEIDIPKNENPQIVWATLRDAAIRVGVIDPVILEFLQGDEPFGQAFIGSGHLVEVEYTIESEPSVGAISRRWRRNTRVEQCHMGGIAPNVDRPDRITISIYAKELVEALLAPSTPGEALATLANDKVGMVRGGVAENPSAPIEVLAKLANDEDVDVRRRIALSLSTPIDILATLANDKVGMVRGGVASNPSAPIEVLAKLANDEDVDVRRRIALSLSTPIDILATLANDEERDVRYYIAGNNRTPIDVLVTLASDQIAEVRSAVARNPSAPVGVLRTLASDTDEYVRRRVARNPSTPVGVLTILANDQTTCVRRAVALNPSTSVGVLRTLSSDEYWTVRVGVSENPSAPVDALRKLANEQYPDVRTYVARNLSTPIDVLTTLANDQTVKVRSAVASNPSTPASVLTTLANDRDEDVRNAIVSNTSITV